MDQGSYFSERYLLVMYVILPSTNIYGTPVKCKALSYEFQIYLGAKGKRCIPLKCLFSVVSKLGTK